MKNQSGFSPVEVVVVLVIIGVVSGAGWFVWSKNKPVETKTTTQSSQSTDTAKTDNQNKAADEAPEDKYADWTQASFELAEMDFKYPKSLTMTHETDADAGPNLAIEKYTLTASDGSKIKLEAASFTGGFSGDQPASLVEDVISGGERSDGQKFSAIIYKDYTGKYSNVAIVNNTDSSYKAGEEKQIFSTSFGVTPKDENKVNLLVTASITGPGDIAYDTVAELKALEAYKDIEMFLNALNVSKPM